MQVFTLISDSKSAQLQYAEATKTLILTFKKPYEPIETFISVMEEIEAFAHQEPIAKMIFDKSNLTVFHQPSMEWYHTVWKVRMLKKGLRVYRKILPVDRLFTESVRIGREKIIKNNPSFDISAFDIQYCNSVEEAMKR